MEDAKKLQQLQHLVSLALGGAGIGLFGRGAMSLIAGQQHPMSIPFVSPGPSVLQIPVADEPEQKPQPQLQKLAAGLFDQVKGWMHDNIALPAARMIPDGPDPISGALAEGVSDPRNAPIMYPLGVGAGALGVAGGWSLADWMLERRRKAQGTEDLENAKRDFQTALLQQARASRQARGLKVASTEAELGDKLDELYDALEEKQAKLKTLTDYVAAGPGLYYTALALLGGGAAAGMYNWTKNRSPTHLLNQAVRERARALWAKSPQAVQVVPTHVPASKRESTYADELDTSVI